MNRISDASQNSQVVRMGSPLPWLQDTAEQAVWSRWGIEYRDVLILDPLNRPIDKDNLSIHDLGIAANRESLRRKILAAATPIDADRDGLADPWELLHFGDLQPDPAGDADHDGVDHFTEMAFGSDPRDAASYPRLAPSRAVQAGKPLGILTYRRLAADLVPFELSSSNDLRNWVVEPGEGVRVGIPVQVYDGSGTEEFRVTLASDRLERAPTFLRVRPVGGAR